VAIALPSSLSVSDSGVAMRVSEAGGAVRVLTSRSGRRCSNQRRIMPRNE
jgi:hypothetical protein